VLGTGDSDFTPLVHKLRELNRRVIGIGIEASTSALLPPACDEFLFYERLDGVELAAPKRKKATRSTTKTASSRRAAEPADAADEPALVQPEDTDLDRLVTQTLSGLERGTSGPVVASTLKRTILRKDPTFNETTYGFRGFLELLRHLESRGVIALSEGTNQGDPAISLAGETEGEDKAFEALGRVVAKATTKSGAPALSGLKTQLRRTIPDFSEKRFGYGGFLQFAKAARARGVIELDFDDEVGDYVVRPGSAATPS